MQGDHDTDIPLNMMRHIANSFHHRTGVNWEELYAEACLAYYEARETYNPEKNVKLSTWAYFKITKALQSFIMQEKQYMPYENIEILQEVDIVQMFHVLSELSPEAQTICLQIFSTPEDYMTIIPKLARGRLKQQLRCIGWSWADIYSAFTEIKKALAI